MTVAVPVRTWRVTARTLTVLAVIAATLAGAYLALVSFRQDWVLPVRLRADLRTVDRNALQRVADGAGSTCTASARRRATRSPPTCAR